MQESSTTWIYTLSDPRFPGVVRYVGKTRMRPGRRLRSHLHDAYREPGNHRRYWLRTLIEAGVEPVLILIEECLGDNWESRERHWIATYKAAGCNLVNATDGGEDNKTLCAESRAKISQSKQGQRKGVPLTPEHREKIRQALKGQVIPPEARAKMSAAAKVKVLTPQHCAKLAESLRKHRPGPDAIARRAEKRGGDYILISPTGEEIAVHNLSAFCRERGLHRANLSQVLRGHIRHSQGWRIRRPEDTET